MTAEPFWGISAAEAAEILGIRASSVHRLVRKGVISKTRKHARGGLDRATVERLALSRLPLQRRSGSHPYWATTGEAAATPGVTRGRVHQLVARGFLPAVQHDGHWYFRREQLEVVANARDARKWADA